MNLSALGPSPRTRKPALIAVCSGAIIAAIIAAAGCNSTSAPRTIAPTTGSLGLTVVTPTGVTGSVTVTGPAGYSKSASATTTLTGLAPGNYVVAATPVVTADPIVGTVESATVSGSPVTVTASRDTETATVTYTPRAGTGGLWVGSFTSGVIAEMSAAQLAAGTPTAATIALTVPSSNGVGMAFDGNGNLWTAKSPGDSIVEYSAAELGSSGAASPSVVLTNSAINRPGAMAFDANGDLWVTNTSGNTAIEFTASQLAASGSPAPTVVLSATAGSMSRPYGVAFDASGDMWVASTGVLVEYTPSQLTVSGSPTPAITITANETYAAAALGMAIDAAGGIWIANGIASPYSIVGYSASQLTTSGNPAPAVTLTPNNSSLSVPAGIAFDASGNMWVANVAASTLVEFTPSQINSSGSPVPTITIASSSATKPFALAFNPHATGFPLKP
jgi:sugar lactone lactonase YvrE